METTCQRQLGWVSEMNPITKYLNSMQLKNWRICSVHKLITWNVKTFYTVFSSTCRLGTNKKTFAMWEKCWMVAITCVGGVSHGLQWTRAGQQKFVHAAMWYTLSRNDISRRVIYSRKQLVEITVKHVVLCLFCWRDIPVLNNENWRMLWRTIGNYCSWNHLCKTTLKRNTVVVVVA